MQEFENQPGNEMDENGTSPETYSADVIFENLSNSRRRAIIKCLWSCDESVPISTVVERVAAAENDTDVESLTYEQRKRVYTTLHQSHLPKLEEDGFIERDRDEIRLTAAADQLKAHMRLYASARNDRSTRSENGLLSSIATWLPF